MNLAALIKAEHFRYRRCASENPSPGEFIVPNQAGLAVDAPRTPLIDQAVADLTTFCDTCLQVNLRPATAKADIRLRLTGGAGPGAVLDPASEAFMLSITSEGVLIEAVHERGLLHGTHYLERLMADRGGPFLSCGQSKHAPVFIPRMTIAIGGIPLSDEYLSLMSHLGANGMQLKVELTQCSHSRIIPELSDPNAEKNLAALNKQVAHLLKHGIDAYFYVCVRPLPADHPAFTANPSRRGAPYRVFDDMAPQNVLCSANEEVLSYYDEAVADFFRAVPQAAGAVMLVGGEGFMHCYSRPFGPFEGYSSCPRCRDHEPAIPVAQLVNRFAAAVKRTGTHKAVFAWPYSAFTWSGNEDRAQLRWMEQLSDDVRVLSNFATNSPDTRNGAGVYLYDYNIKSVGPSDVFRAQAAKAAGQGRRIYCKTESNVTPDTYFLPYIPVHFRWHGRFRAMAQIGVAGYMGNWGFYGMNGSLPEEMQYHANWSPDVKVEDLLYRAAQRDFGAAPDAARQIVAAWRKLSDAWDDFPYSAMTNGEREFYARGPMHYGPAHPLIFNTQNRYKLPAKFFGISGDLKDLATPEEVAALLKDAKPRYVSELLLTLPYGVNRYLELTSRCRQLWSEGLASLKQAMGDQPPERARMELDICELMDIHLTTLEHVVRFLAARDRLGQTPVTISAFREILDELAVILRSEIANAERSLPILARDCRLHAYDADMVKEKLRQCRYVLEQELPLFNVSVRFHVWNDFP